MKELRFIVLIVILTLLLAACQHTAQNPFANLYMFYGVKEYITVKHNYDRKTNEWTAGDTISRKKFNSKGHVTEYIHYSKNNTQQAYRTEYIYEGKYLKELRWYGADEKLTKINVFTRKEGKQEQIGYNPDGSLSGKIISYYNDLDLDTLVVHYNAEGEETRRVATKYRGPEKLEEKIYIDRKLQTVNVAEFLSDTKREYATFDSYNQLISTLTGKYKESNLPLEFTTHFIKGDSLLRDKYTYYENTTLPQQNTLYDKDSIPRWTTIYYYEFR